MKKILIGKFTSKNLKPKIEDNKILFASSSEIKYIEEDGLSFGYPVDSGWVTEVLYKQAKGAVDDVIALFKKIENFHVYQQPSQGVMAIKEFNYSSEELNNWKRELSFEWAYRDIHEDIKEKGVEEVFPFNETVDELVERAIDNPNLFPKDWRDAYEISKNDLHKHTGNLDKVLTNDELELFKDENGDYFFKTKYHNFGAITKADKKSALNYIADFQLFNKSLKEKNKLINKLNNKIELLKATIN